MGFYIGPDKKGYRAEIKQDDGVTVEETFESFSQAVNWIENNRDENETERSKEENA